MRKRENQAGMERLDGEFSASPTYANELIYLSDRAGKTTVIRPGKELKIYQKMN